MSAAAIQNRVSPPTPSSGLKMNDADVKSAAKAKDGGSADQKVDFRDLLTSSNVQAQVDREFKKSDNLGAAKSEDEFFKRLENKTKQTRAPKNTLDKDDFLKLFVTQLQNQDPTSPKDSSEMASQLAQFNSLEQMLNLNKGVEKLAKNQNTSRSLELVGYIGKEVTIPKGRFRFEGAGAKGAATFNNTLDINEATMVIRDSSGITVAERSIGKFNPGEHTVEWDGKKKDGSVATAGVYMFEINGKGPQGEQIPVDIKTRVKVTGIDLTDDGSFVTEIGKIKADEIKAVNLPDIANSSPAANSEKKEDKNKASVPPLPGDLANLGASPNVTPELIKELAKQREDLVKQKEEASKPTKVEEPPKEKQPKQPPPPAMATNENIPVQTPEKLVSTDVFHPQVLPNGR